MSHIFGHVTQIYFTPCADVNYCVPDSATSRVERGCGLYFVKKQTGQDRRMRLESTRRQSGSCW
jgi:hypothetical protein